MAAKILIIALSIASAQASGGVSGFSYGVSDPNTGDVKSQHEKRVGETVVGQYSLLEPDGTKRIVEYSSNPQTGFKAIVRKDPLAVHPAPAAYQGLGYAAHSGLGYGTHSGYGSHSALGYAALSGYGAHFALGYGAHSALGYGAHSALGYGYGGHNLGYAAYNLGYGAQSPLAYSGYSASPLTYDTHTPAVSSYSATINHGGYTAPYAHGFGYGAGYGKYGAPAAPTYNVAHGLGYGDHGLGW